MNKKTIFLLMLMIMLSVSIQAQAHKKIWPSILPNLRFGLYMAENNLFEARFILRLKNEIGLTPAQEQKIENMMLANEEAAIRRGSDIKVLELKFAALLKNNRIDRRAMEDMARAMGKLKTDLQVDHLNYLLDLRDTLTPEQIQKIEKLKKDIPERMRDKMHGRSGYRGDFPPPMPPDEKDDGPSDPEDL
ncbi:MAG: Spy/CpxP family protein refolding chaperone [Candidatus Aminicenantes bacterium]|nr:Spy/CpxP family protein refolding chaperone [Candidatus Aminicenantes bacterium]